MDEDVEEGECEEEVELGDEEEFARMGWEFVSERFR